MSSHADTSLPLPPTKISMPPPTTTQIPLPTPPASVRSTSPNMNTSSTTTTTTTTTTKPAVPFPSSSHQPTRSVSFSANSVPFPSSTASTTINHDTTSSTTTTDDTETRPRYHSTLSRPAVPPLQQSKSFGSKLQSLRKKIEGELSRKRPGSSATTSSQTAGGKRQSGTKKAQKGTVAGLRPSPALTVPEGMSVADASQLCAAKRTDCVLVVDDEEGLSGIFTAKDLAFRVSPVPERGLSVLIAYRSPPSLWTQGQPL